MVVFDLRNHGASSWAEAMDYPAMAEDVRAAMTVRGHHCFAVVGHSMGGKAAMTLALTEPEAVERLIVVDIAPVALPAPVLSHIRAMRALDLNAIDRRRDADAELGAAIPDPAERGFLLQSLVFAGDTPRWQLNLAALEAALPAIGGFPEFPSSTRYDGPTLFIAGGKSSVLPADAEPIIRAFFPRATIERIANAGHWVHAEQPAAFLTLVEPFLAANAD